MSTSGVAGRTPIPASHVLGRKLDSIPFSAYHILVILVLGAVGFVEGYDLALGGSLLALAKEPLQLTGDQVRWLAVAPTLLVVVGAFTASAISDRISRKTVMQIGVVVSTFFTLLVPLAQSGAQLIIIRLLTGAGLGVAISAPFPIAAELMPKQHRRTFGAIFEVTLAIAFMLLPFLGYLLAGTGRLPADRAAGRACHRDRAVVGAFRPTGEPALVSAQGQPPSGSRDCQSDDRELWQPCVAADGP